MGARGTIGGPERRRVFGGMFGNGETFPDPRTVMFEVGHEARRGRGLAGFGGAAGERDDGFGDVEPGEADQQPAAHRPARIAAIADQRRACGHVCVLRLCV
jgi:hypothetical protein